VTVVGIGVYVEDEVKDWVTQSGLLVDGLL
jgi:hypothetical protein